MQPDTLLPDNQPAAPQVRPPRRPGPFQLWIGSFLFGLLGGAFAVWGLIENPSVLEHLGRPSLVTTETKSIVVSDDQVVKTVERASPSVVSIVVTADVPRLRRYSDPFGFFFDTPFDEESLGGRQEVGAGTGFFVTADGLIATNKHVVSSERADYTVITQDGKELPASVVARDPNRDFALIRVEGSGFPVLEWGDSEKLRVGETVIAIGNSLGEFSNTVSRGIISGLQRDVVAGSSRLGDEERLQDIIQTDAAINPGNSGGPLLDLEGRVVGINVAVAQGAQNIGFAIPINQVKQSVEQVKTLGRIATPYLGVRYVLIDDELAAANRLPFDHGALIARGDTVTDFAVIPGSPADKAGLMENDIILEIGGQRVDSEHPLGDLIADAKPGDAVILKVWHKGETKTLTVTLEERPQ